MALTTIGKIREQGFGVFEYFKGGLRTSYHIVEKEGKVFGAYYEYQNWMNINLKRRTKESPTFRKLKSLVDFLKKEKIQYSYNGTFSIWNLP